MKKNRTQSSAKSQRQLQIGEQVKRIFAEIFLQDNLFSNKKIHITILQADVSPDGKNAKIFINVFGCDDAKKINAELKQITPYLRGKISAKVNLRHTPELLFIIDKTEAHANKIEDLLAQESKKFS
ncbi:MAG: ribosome-binding factor A [Rickettsiales bacterium]|jgi:ribosome-binding factor A